MFDDKQRKISLSYGRGREKKEREEDVEKEPFTMTRYCSKVKDQQKKNFYL